MSRQEVEAYFDLVGTWMRTDIKREIEMARASLSEDGRQALEALGVQAGGGNLLAALGLVAYTEALGRLRVWNRTQPRTTGSPAECFGAFFERMAGGAYVRWWASWSRSGGKAIYEVLRNGLVHEYQPKVDSEFHIGAGEVLGLGETAEGALVFRVEPYHRDFCAEMAALRAELAAQPDPQVPPPSDMSGRGRGGSGSQSVGSGGFWPGPIVRPTS